MYWRAEPELNQEREEVLKRNDLHTYDTESTLVALRRCTGAANWCLSWGQVFVGWRFILRGSRDKRESAPLFGHALFVLATSVSDIAGLNRMDVIISKEVV